MFTLPFLSRRSHSAILASKDEVIAELRAQLNMLHGLREDDRADRARLDTRILELVEKSLTPPPSPPEPRRRRRDEAEDRTPEPHTLDLAMVDPNDYEMIARLVARELPRGQRVSASALQQQVTRMQQQIMEAHAVRAKELVVSAKVPAPSNVLDQINAAEQAGRQMAAGE